MRLLVRLLRFLVRFLGRVVVEVFGRVIAEVFGDGFW